MVRSTPRTRARATSGHSEDSTFAAARSRATAFSVEPDFTSNTNGDDGSESGWASHHQAAATAPIATSASRATKRALKLYRLDNQRYPTTEQGLNALVARPTDAPVPANWKPNGYLERLPKDPWGQPYQYLNPGLRGEIDVYSFGADGQPGGTGVDAD